MSVEQYIKEYQSGMSIGEIAEKYGTYTNKIRRDLIKANCPIRSKAEAQKLALSRGTAIHPTQGKKRTVETKERISNKVSSSWKNMTPEQAKDRSEKMAKIWMDKPEIERIEMTRKAAQAVAKAGRDGSKTEIFIGNELQKLGYNTIIHKKSLVSNTNLELDIFVPELKLVIEVDGPSHFLPIWGEEALTKRISLDAEKNGLLLQEGYSIIRLKCLVKNMTKKRQRDAFNKIVSFLDKNKKKNYFEEIEVV